jgi:hypothetical protein
MNMYWKLMSIAGLSLLVILTLALVFSPRSQAQTANPVSATYAYKVERISRNSKDMDRVLSEDGKDGWRVWRVEAVGPYNNDLVFLMEKPAPQADMVH